MLQAYLLYGLAFATAALATAHANHNSRHHAIAAKRAEGEELQKRETFTNSRFTFFDDGLGACGVWNKSSDFIVALNTPQYGGGYPGPHCFEWITIEYGGKQHGAQIVDECPGCGWGQLDFSRGLFNVFASEDKGEIFGTWWFDGSGGGGGGGGGGDDSQPTTTKHHTTTHTTKTTTPTTTKHHTTSSSATSSTASPTTSTTAKSTSTTTSTGDSEDGSQAIFTVNEAFSELTSFLRVLKGN